MENELAALQQKYDQLQKQYNLLRLILDNLPDVISFKDAEGRFRFMNATGYEGFGGSLDALIGKTDADFLDEESAAKLRQTEVEAMETGVPYHAEELPRPNQWVLTTKKPVYDDSEAVLGLVCISRDINEFKAAQDRQAEQQRIIEMQRSVLDDVSTPVIPIMEGILILPLIGSLDTHRAQHLMRSLLEGITQHRAKVIIMDITGVPMVDTGIADYLNKTIQAARLKGAHTIVTGISDAVSETIIDLGIDWNEIDTLRDLQSGLDAAIAFMEKRTSKTGVK